MTPDDTPRDAGEDTRERTEHIARVLHDAATGRITPDPADPTPYGRMLNLRVLLDGTDVHWVAAARQGRKPGEWTHLRRR